ncbi:GNAT family N-acetyltransferase [Leptolyngbya sp. O-77]|uniref:GNAT family N-acetyltransferase n=1 Tax=Leptolyngbya sp. O-77 TaxID=1080068 RepID=UPI00074D2FED|nr:GNAT family N-acetyltransferase [Leptolyngbya sp. O-77]BAU40733.1 Acetyltransferase (GNAT) family protein [Leptolyngbya sp. O-77]
MHWQVRDLQPDDTALIQQLAAMLVDAFGRMEHGWRTLPSALAEVEESLAGDRLSRVAVLPSGEVIGWIGAIAQYRGSAWELHPLVVQRNWRRRGVGRSLVQDLEQQAAAKGGHTLYLGTDDELGQTSLFGVDLYCDPFQHIAQIRNPGNHPYKFYQKMGFQIVGVLPDVNGPGKPDILMAKRLVQGFLS